MNFDFKGEWRQVPKTINHKGHEGTRRKSFVFFSNSSSFIPSHRLLHKAVGEGAGFISSREATEFG
jgi:hypothetical protein